MGCILPQDGFLKKLRERCSQEGILLIFDEVMTGFRLGFGGAQAVTGVEADLITYGKVIGAGMPVGAYAGKEEIMEYVAPNGPVYQAGTLSGNPIAMTAGYTLLKHLLEQPEIYDSLDQKCTRLHDGLKERLAETNLPHTLNKMGSMVSLHFTNEAVTDFTSAKAGDNEFFKRFFHLMLDQGIYFPPSAYESLFLNDALSEEDIDYTLASAEKAFAQLI